MFSNYLLNGKNIESKVFSVCYEDMWGNISCQDYNEKGLDYNPNVVGFSFEMEGDSKKITFESKREKLDR